MYVCIQMYFTPFEGCTFLLSTRSQTRSLNMSLIQALTEGVLFIAMRIGSYTRIDDIKNRFSP